MSTSVCLSVCLSARISPELHAILTNLSVHVAYGRGSVLLQQGDEILRERTPLGDFFSTDNALHGIWDPLQKGLNRSRCRLE